MTTAEKYRQKEASAVIQIAKYIFNVTLKDEETLPLGSLLKEIKTGNDHAIILLSPFPCSICK